MKPMKNNSIRWLLLSIYGLLLLTCAGILYYNYHHLYNQVTVLEDREEIIRQSQLSIPVRITVSNDIWGSHVFENEEVLQKIWKAIHDIISGPGETAPSYPLKDDVKIQGRIEYLSGAVDEFEISSRFILNGQVYDDNYKMPLIDNLKNDLLWYLYSQQQIASLVEQASEVKVYTKQLPSGRALLPTERKLLEEQIGKARKLESNREITALLKKKGEASAHLRIYLQAEPSGKIRAAQMINIDTYPDDFFVIQYMGDENGRHLYFQGNLQAVLQETEKNANE